MAADVCLSKCLLYILFLFVSASENPPGLYKIGHNVEILNDDNFVSLIYGKTNSWYVEFYNSWCGHCIRFAPTWIKLAKDTKGWASSVKFAALDCAVEDNLPICREFNVDGYPSFRFFPCKSVNASSALTVEAVDGVFTKVRQQVVDFLSDKTKSKLSSWPVLDPVKIPSDADKSSSSNTKYNLIIFEEEKSYIGREVILDMSRYKEINIRRILQKNSLKLGITEYPSMYMMETDGSLKKMNQESSRRHFVKVLMSLIGESFVENEVSEAVIKQAKNLIANNTSYSLAVHMQDLESTIHYSLRQEIAGKQLLEAHDLNVLRDYIAVLAKYFPGRLPFKRALHGLYTYIHDYKEESLPGEQWLKIVDSFKGEKGEISNEVKWTGCKGTDPKLRGYNCGLWSLFHTLTVNADLQMEDGGDYTEPKEVLAAMKGYIKTFFGCKECVKNFLKMAESIESLVKEENDGILWLWKSHNKANKRLHGDPTEDVNHPKVQFPPKELCPKCQNGEKDGEIIWDNENVLIFLKAFYGAKGIILDDKIDIKQGNRIAGSDKLSRRSDLEKLAEKKYAKQKELKKEKPSLNQKPKLNDKKIERLKTIEFETREGSKAVRVFTSMGLNHVDISFCVLFYILCTGIIMLLYYHFTWRRSRFKRSLFPV